MIRFLSISILLMSCLDKPRQDIELNSVATTEFGLPRGTWLLAQYFDSAITKVSVYDVKTVKPSLFGAIVVITADSLTTYGTMDDHVFRLSDAPKDASIEIKGSYGDWRLTTREGSLFIQEITLKGEARTFSYRRYTPMLSSDLSEKEVKTFLTTFFTKHILSGEYEVETPKSKNASRIKFSENGDLKNFVGFDRYEINPFYGPRNPYSESDALVVWNSKNDSSRIFAWTFKDDNLVLFNIADDEEYPGEVFHKGNEFMSLKKLK
jgi:hypothetical protein